MSTKISGIDNRAAPVASGQPVRRSQDSTTENAPPAHPSAPVQITDAARQLAALEQALKSVPVVNEAKVAEIRKAIADGTYKIEPEKIADSLLRNDQEMAQVIAARK
jgi:negative regulator of flagellin synthesis FlgM